MGTRSPLDRSAAHEALLYTNPEFPHADLDRGSQIITEFLEDFYRSPSLNMYEFARSWRQAPPALPPDVPASRQGGQARATARDGKMGVRRG